MDQAGNTNWRCGLAGRSFVRALTVVICLLAFTTVAAQRVSGAEADYLTQVKPLLAARCYACHGALKQEGGLRLDTGEAIRRGGDSGAIVDRATPAASLLVARVSTTDIAERMPPEGEGEALKPDEIEVLRSWIQGGSPSPADEVPEADPQSHWAFRSIERPNVPTAGAAWSRGAIDAFIAAEHKERGLTPLAEAEESLLLRRLYLDLIGLPPTLVEQDAFVADDAPDAYERVVDRLLASPQFGERWGRHYMDIWRYSDWWGLGAEVRNSQKHIWHWRDWIIESLNVDKGYDQMVREMLAADELYPSDLEKLRGGGLLARHYFKFNRTTWLDETVEHTSKAFLGVTMNCCKCHDHKYDPFTQEEYYQFRAIFEPYQLRTEMLPGQVDFEKDGLPRPFDCNLEAPTYLHRRGDDRQPVTDKPLGPAIPKFLAFEPLQVTAVELPAEAYQPGLREHVTVNEFDRARQQTAAARQQAVEAQKKLSEAEAAGTSGTDLDKLRAALKVKESTAKAAELDEPLVQARAAADRARALPGQGGDAMVLAREAARLEKVRQAADAERQVAQSELDLLNAEETKKAEVEKKLEAAREALVRAQANVENPGEAYQPLVGALKTLESNVETEESRKRPFPKTSTGRRSALAHWLVDRRNPLTARVAVNHVWSRHLGQPIVPTVFDFGRKGLPPTHPELLDWLSMELMERDWSLKHLHRKIVLSSTYRLSGATGGSEELKTMVAANQSRDTENRFYWKAPSRRMESQAVRDSLLCLSGELDLSQGGPPVAVNEEKLRRRSLYFFHSHNEHQKLLSIFDDANVLECYRRSESIVPQQALALANSRASLEAAAAIALSIERDELADEAFIERSWRTMLCEQPTAEEVKACQEALRRLEASAAGDESQKRHLARKSLVHALLNHNDFLTVR